MSAPTLERTASASSSWNARRWTQPVVLGLAVFLTRLPGLVTDRLFNTDEATLSVGGRELADGGSLYVGVIDRKPPLPFLLYATFGGGDLRPVRVVIALSIFVAALVVASEARRRWGARAGWAAGLVLVLGASALGPMDAQAANFELFALLPIVVAVVAAARGRAVLAGVALAVAVLCKQPAAVTIVPVAWCWWQTRRWRGVLGGLAAGAVAALVLTFPFKLSRVMEWALLGTGGYLSMDPSDIGYSLLRLLYLVLLAAGFWGGAWLLAVAPRVGPAVDPDPVVEPGAALVVRGDAVDVWLLLGVSCLGVVAGFRFFPHYLVQLLPALALLAGRGAAVARPVVRRAALVWGLGASVVAAALGWHMGLDPKPAYPRDMAAYARAHTDGGDEILVWGNVPEVYWRADRQPAGGFTHTEFITDYSGGRRAHAASEQDVPDVELYRAWIRRLHLDPPTLVFDTAAADLRGGRYFPLSRFPEVTKLLDERYERVATVDGVPVYRLVDPGSR
ncbi:hypothetical protein BH10ACT1_BH10ACT1_41770 [soil metagenome]